MPHGVFTLVDEKDAEVISNYSWSLSNGYPATRINGKLITLHQFLMGTADGLVTDHRDRNKLNNRRDNFRTVTQAINIGNTVVGNRKSAKKYRGVHKIERGNKWAAMFRSKYLGSFDTDDDAARAYDAAVRAHYGAESVVTNFEE